MLVNSYSDNGDNSQDGPIDMCVSVRMKCRYLKLLLLWFRTYLNTSVSSLTIRKLDALTNTNILHICIVLIQGCIAKRKVFAKYEYVSYLLIKLNFNSKSIALWNSLLSIFASDSLFLSFTTIVNLVYNLLQTCKVCSNINYWKRY